MTAAENNRLNGREGIVQTLRDARDRASAGIKTAARRIEAKTGVDLSSADSILALALAAQLLLIAFAFWPREGAGEGRANAPLMAFEGAVVDRILLSDGGTETAVEYADGGWSLPDYHGLPAAKAILDRILKDLPALRRGWPVAASAAAAERFEVAAGGFQRRVEYFAGDDSLGILYIGTSPGFRKVHARLDDGDDIFAIEFNVFDAPADPAGWLHKTLLAVSGINAITGADYRLIKEGDEWRGEGGQTPDETELNRLVDGLQSLRVNEAADAATADILHGMDAPPILRAQSAAGEYAFHLYEVEDAHYIARADIKGSAADADGAARADRPVYFSLSSFDYERLAEPDAAALFPEPEPEPAPEPAAAE